MSTRKSRSVAALVVVGLALTALAPQGTSASAEVVHTVVGTGDPDVDAANIESALLFAQPHDTVRLVGEFKLNRPVEVWNFIGTLAGDGSEATQIRTVDGFGVGSSGIPSMFAFRYFSNVEPVELVISGLTLTSEEPTEPWGAVPGYERNFLWEFVFVDGLSDAIDVKVSDVGFVGRRDPVFTNATGSSAITGLTVWRSTGRMDWSNVSVSDVHSCGLVAQYLTGSAAVVNEIVALDTGPAVCILDSSGVDADVAYVSTSRAAGVYVESAPWSTASSISIHDNSISLPARSYWAGIEMWDRADQGEKSDFDVRDNTIVAAEVVQYGLLWAVWVDDATVTDNRYVGTAPYAMWLDTTNLFPVGEDFSQFQRLPDDPIGFVPSTAEIVLGRSADHNLLLGHLNIAPPESELTVLDLTDDPATDQYDGANVLVNVNGVRGRYGFSAADRSPLLADPAFLR